MSNGPMTTDIPDAEVPVFKPGDAVWFRPAVIGYGYAYGVDIGIPAIVEATHTGDQPRSRISFSAKPNAAPLEVGAYTRVVKDKSLTRRAEGDTIAGVSRRHLAEGIRRARGNL